MPTMEATREYFSVRPVGSDLAPAEARETKNGRQSRGPIWGQACTLSEATAAAVALATKYGRRMRVTGRTIVRSVDADGTAKRPRRVTPRPRVTDPLERSTKLAMESFDRAPVGLITY